MNRKNREFLYYFPRLAINNDTTFDLKETIEKKDFNTILQEDESHNWYGYCRCVLSGGCNRFYAPFRQELDSPKGIFLDLIYR
jgi:hypothetical protein